jgi:hypothetical protein
VFVSAGSASKGAGGSIQLMSGAGSGSGAGGSITLASDGSAGAASGDVSVVMADVSGAKASSGGRPTDHGDQRKPELSCKQSRVGGKATRELIREYESKERAAEHCGEHCQCCNP